MNVRGLNDMNPDRDKKDDPNKKTTQSYAGGEKSGIAIQNPDDLTKHRGEGPLPAGATTVTLYRNGFTVDGGEFRPASDPENAQFVRDLMEGKAPRELQETHIAKGRGGGQLSIALNDKRQEDYKAEPGKAPPKKVAEVFTGQGLALGGSSSSSSAAASAVDTSATGNTVDESRPTTTIQIRFHNGQRKAEKFNEDQTVGDLYDAMQRAAPVNGTFKIISGFPPKEVSASRATTLKDAGLLNSAVTQKI